MKRVKKQLQIAIMIPLALSLSACHILDTWGLRDETIYPPAFPIDNPAPPKSNGTIYQEGHEIALYEDPIAARIGDILTVRLEEATQGEKQAKTKANKTTTNNTDNGVSLSTSGTSAIKPILLGGTLNSAIFDTGTDLEFDGKGQTNQYNKLHGTISVTVTRVLSNRNMVIQGESWVTINEGREYVRLTGIVRRDDIEPGNTISSQRIADSRISYSGAGLVGNSSRGGLLTEFLYKFFPY